MNDDCLSDTPQNEEILNQAPTEFQQIGKGERSGSVPQTRKVGGSGDGGSALFLRPGRSGIRICPSTVAVQMMRRWRGQALFLEVLSLKNRYPEIVRIIRKDLQDRASFTDSTCCLC